jgi:uncharacterized protein
MKYTIKVKTNAKENAVEKGPSQYLSISENLKLGRSKSPFMKRKLGLGPGGELRVRVKAPPQEGRANEAVIETLAAHFKVPKSYVAIVGGFKSKTKIVRIGACEC